MVNLRSLIDSHQLQDRNHEKLLDNFPTMMSDRIQRVSQIKNRKAGSMSGSIYVDYSRINFFPHVGLTIQQYSYTMNPESSGFRRPPPQSQKAEALFSGEGQSNIITNDQSTSCSIPTSVLASDLLAEEAVILAVK